MKNIIKSTIDQFKMFVSGETVIVAVSGGMDSVFLLHLLYALKDELKINLCVCHLNHLLRENADRDCEFVCDLADSLGLECVIGQSDAAQYARQNNLSVEEAARYVRYNFFLKEAKSRGINTIAVGHTFDDQAETVLMRIIKGTGLRGLCGIYPVLNLDEVKVVRPLINVNRLQITEFIRDNRLRFVEDESNNSLHFDRNKVRHLLMPLLETRFNEKVKEALFKLSFTAKADNNFFNELSQKEFNRLVIEKNKNCVVFNCADIINIHEALAYRIFEFAFEFMGFHGLCDFNHWQEIWGGLQNKTLSQVCLGMGVKVSVQQTCVVIEKKIKNESGIEYRLLCGEEVYIEEFGMNISCVNADRKDVVFNKNAHEQFFSADKLEFPLIIRKRKKGDSMQPLGMHGRRKIKDILIDSKVPRYKRDSMPVVLSGNEIVWLVPCVLSETVRIDDNTNKILKISIKNDI